MNWACVVLAAQFKARYRTIKPVVWCYIQITDSGWLRLLNNLCGFGDKPPVRSRTRLAEKPRKPRAFATWS